MKRGRQIAKRTRNYVKFTHEDFATFLRSIEAALGSSSAARARGAGGCCDDVCSGHGGCRFGDDVVAVCKDDCVFLCDPED